MHLNGDHPGDINFTLLEASLITINLVGSGFSFISLPDSDISKLRDAAIKSEKIAPATSVTVPSNGANRGKETS